jgi:hypothetical protein
MHTSNSTRIVCDEIASDKNLITIISSTNVGHEILVINFDCTWLLLEGTNFDKF